MTNLEWMLSLPVEDMEKRFLREECTCCVYDNTEECDNRSCVEGKLKWLSKEHVPELKPCPFCGGEARFQSGVICCSDCCVKTRYTSNRELAIATWNRRVNDGKVDGD